MSSRPPGRLYCADPHIAGRAEAVMGGVDPDGIGVPPFPVGGARFRRQEVTIPAGCRLPVVEEDWLGAIVVVERGEVDLVCRHGGRRRFGAGAVLWFDGLDLRAIENPGTVDLVLVSVSRAERPTPPSPSGAPRGTVPP